MLLINCYWGDLKTIKQMILDSSSSFLKLLFRSTWSVTSITSTDIDIDDVMMFLIASNN